MRSWLSWCSRPCRYCHLDVVGRDVTHGTKLEALGAEAFGGELYEIRVVHEDGRLEERAAVLAVEPGLVSANVGEDRLHAWPGRKADIIGHDFEQPLGERLIPSSAMANVVRSATALVPVGLATREFRST